MILKSTILLNSETSSENLIVWYKIFKLSWNCYCCKHSVESIQKYSNKNWDHPLSTFTEFPENTTMYICVSGNEKCLFKFCVRPKYVVPIQKYYSDGLSWLYSKTPPL